MRDGQEEKIEEAEELVKNLGDKNDYNNLNNAIKEVYTKVMELQDSDKKTELLSTIKSYADVITRGFGIKHRLVLGYTPSGVEAQDQLVKDQLLPLALEDYKELNEISKEELIEEKSKLDKLVEIFEAGTDI